MTRNMDMVFILIQMVDPTKDNGKMGSNMVKEFSLLHKELRDKESGMKVRELNGQMKMISKKKCKYNDHKLLQTILYDSNFNEKQEFDFI